MEEINFTNGLPDPQPVKVGGGKGNDNKGVIVLIAIALVLLVGVLLAITLPGVFGIIADLLRYSLIFLTLLLLLISFLVVVGFREQAKDLLTGIINGSLTSLELMKEIRLGIIRVMVAIRDFFLRFIPFYAFILSVIIYLFILYVYKSVGKTSDVTLMTILISSLTMFFVGFLNRPKPETDHQPTHTERFMRYFNDSFEVMLFLFFLTMDSTNLFFLPDSLNTHLTARIGDFDLMQRGFVVDGMIIATLNIVLATVGIEVSRQFMRVFAYSRRYFTSLKKDDPGMERESVLKQALSRGFQENMDDILKFVTYFTLLIIVFLLFPRLKLLAMLVVSLTALTLDIIIPERLTARRQEDLIGRFLVKVFKL